MTATDSIRRPQSSVLDREAEQDYLRQVEDLLLRQKRVETLVHRQIHDGQRHQLVEALVHKQHLAELRAKLLPIPADSIARLLEALPPDDSLLVWELVAVARGQEVLDQLSGALYETLSETWSETRRRYSGPSRPISIHAFEPVDGRLRHVQIDNKGELAATQPIWVDLLAPSREERQWIVDVFGIKLPDADDLTDLEESARFYVDDAEANADVHLHSAFLLGKEDGARTVAVAFILHNNILFSMRNVELPVFRLQRLRTRIQPGYVSEGTDVLLDLYGADVEYSADVLEDVYTELEATYHALRYFERRKTKLLIAARSQTGESRVGAGETAVDTSVT